MDNLELNLSVFLSTNNKKQIKAKYKAFIEHELMPDYIIHRRNEVLSFNEQVINYFRFLLTNKSTQFSFDIKKGNYSLLGTVKKGDTELEYVIVFSKDNLEYFLYLLTKTFGTK